MSELTELIEIAKNIEKQNDEIIRLLRKIADEKESENKPIIDLGELYLSDDKIPEVKRETPKIENRWRIGSLLDTTIDVGEVYFIEGGDIFKFIQRMDGCTFPEAVDRAAAIGGLDAEADPRWRRLERRRLKERTEKLEREAEYRFRYRLACATVHMVNRKLDGITEWSDSLAELLELREFASMVIDEMDERTAEDG